MLQHCCFSRLAQPRFACPAPLHAHALSRAMSYLSLVLVCPIGFAAHSLHHRVGNRCCVQAHHAAQQRDATCTLVSFSHGRARPGNPRPSEFVVVAASAARAVVGVVVAQAVVKVTKLCRQQRGTVGVAVGAARAARYGRQLILLNKSPDRLKVLFWVHSVLAALGRGVCSGGAERRQPQGLGAVLVQQA